MKTTQVTAMLSQCFEPDRGADTGGGSRASKPSSFIRALWLCFFPAFAVQAQAQFTYVTNAGAITITKYAGSSAVVSIPATINNLPVTSIAQWAFELTYSLNAVAITNNVTSIGPGAFQSCYSLTNVLLGGSITNIGDSAFNSCNLLGVAIPGSVGAIGNSAFGGCQHLAGAVISNGVTRIGSQAFSGCALTNIAIPDTVTNIGVSAFVSCDGLKAINVSTQNPAYSSVAGVLFNKNQTALLEYPAGKMGAYVIPGTVTNVGQAAFSGCIYLNGITIPYGVVAIGTNAFALCGDLPGVVIPDSVSAIGDNAFGGDFSLTSVSLSTNLTRLADDLFQGCSGLGSMIIPGHVSTIGVNTFSQCYQLGSVTIPDSVITIEDYAFQGCTALTNLSLGLGVTSIGIDSFYNCYGLTSVTLPAGVTNLDLYAFGNCYALTGIYFMGNAPNNVATNAFDGAVATVYYLPGTTGWAATLAGLPTAVWRPRILSGGLGLVGNTFGLNIQWADGMSVVVESCTNPAAPVWMPLQTNTISGGSASFSDPHTTNYPARFYRVRSL